MNVSPLVFAISPAVSLILIFISALVGCGIIFLSIYFSLTIRKKKYKQFIIDNSYAYKTINDINFRYRFYGIPNCDMVHSYDNKDFYPTVSPLDYLTYQLQDNKSGKKISKVLKEVKWNRALIDAYKNETESLVYCHYAVEPEKMDKKVLSKYERKIVEELFYNPTTQFSIKVTLRRTNIRGDYRTSKYAIFQEDEIRDLLYLLKNKEGKFYRNKDVWDSIVRVERARVSNKMRFAILKKYGWRCCNCGSKHNLEIDHIYPIAKGGKSEMDNLQVLCHKCNVAKGTDVY